jgi:pimeloyl-ACP methyl ester carboxylesterase
MPALGRVVAEYVDKTFGEPVDVMGHSFGGRTALWMAAQKPQAVDHLVLEAPSGFAPNGSFPTDAETLRKRMFAHPEKRPPGERSPHVANNREATQVYLQGNTFDAELQPRLASITNLTLILQGTADLICPKEAVQALKAKLPKSWLLYVWDAAHAPEIDQPERVLKLVTDFLTQSEAFVVNWGDGQPA